MDTRHVALRNGTFEVEVCEAGSGDPVVYLHGEAGPRWSHYHDLLAGQYRVITPTIAGYGNSTGSDRLQDIHDLIYWGLDLLDALGLRSQPVIGHGLGGMLAAELAAVQPDRVTRLVLMDAFGLWLPDHPTLDYFAATPAELALALYHSQESPAARAAAQAPKEGDAYVAFMVERAKSMATAAKYLWPLPDRGLDRRLHRIAAPTLVVWGESDGVLSPAYGEAMLDRIGDATLNIVRGAGHLPHEEQAEQTAELTLRFLRGRASGTVGSQDGIVVAAGPR
jgi:pimeloyl-ACP methyl ester carboxylesterase